MSLSAPTYVPVESWRHVLPSYAWSDWNPYEAVGHPDALREDELRRLSGRAILAYTIACAEWVVYRLTGFLDDARPEWFLEAAWAFEMSERFAAPVESVEAEWKGPVRGAVDLALMTVLNAIYSLRDGAVEVDAAFAEQLAQHVVPEMEPFLAWRGRVLPRLANQYPANHEARYRYVPREATDPDYNICDEDHAEALVMAFLRNLDTATNPMLEPVSEA